MSPLGGTCSTAAEQPAHQHLVGQGVLKAPHPLEAMSASRGSSLQAESTRSKPTKPTLLLAFALRSVCLRSLQARFSTENLTQSALWLPPRREDFASAHGVSSVSSRNQVRPQAEQQVLSSQSAPTPKPAPSNESAAASATTSRGQSRGTKAGHFQRPKGTNAHGRCAKASLPERRDARGCRHYAGRP